MYLTRISFRAYSARQKQFNSAGDGRASLLGLPKKDLLRNETAPLLTSLTMLGALGGPRYPEQKDYGKMGIYGKWAFTAFACCDTLARAETTVLKNG